MRRCSCSADATTSSHGLVADTSKRVSHPVTIQLPIPDSWGRTKQSEIYKSPPLYCMELVEMGTLSRFASCTREASCISVF